MKSLDEYRKQKMKDLGFRHEYKKLEPDMSISRAIIDARLSQNMTQKELAEKTGLAQSEISRLERGLRNPSVALLQRLADGMGMDLHITFTPKNS